MPKNNFYLQEIAEHYTGEDMRGTDNQLLKEIAEFLASGAPPPPPGEFDPASPGPIGGTTPGTGVFTTLSATDGANIGGATIDDLGQGVFSNLSVSSETTLNIAVATSFQVISLGNVAPGTGAFTTLSASGAVTMPNATGWSVNGDVTARDIIIGSGRTITLRSGVTISSTNSGRVDVTGGVIIEPSQVLSGAGAVNLTTRTTRVTTTGAAQAFTLADGAQDQIKTIVHVSDGGSAVLTPTTKTGFTTVTFTNVGETVTLQFHTTIGWVVLSIFGAVAA